MQRISFIGSGQVATHLAKKMAQQNHIVQILSPNVAHATALAEKVNAAAITDISLLNQEIDLLVIAVNDQSIEIVAAQLAQLKSTVLTVHTSGSTDIQVLSKYLANVGVFYPLQTFSHNSVIDWQQTPLFLEALSVTSLKMLQQLAHSMSDRVYVYSSQQRLTLHLAAVIAGNFSNYCYDIAKQIADAEHVDFSLIYPLILETANKATLYDPHLVQTGPAAREDLLILQKHEALLVHLKRLDLRDIYQIMSDGIIRNKK